MSYDADFVYGNYILKPSLLIQSRTLWIDFYIQSTKDTNKSLYVNYHLIKSKEIFIREEYSTGLDSADGHVTQKELTDILNEYGLSVQKLIAISQKMIKEICDADNQKLPTATPEKKKKDLENIKRIFNKQNNKQIHYTKNPEVDAAKRSHF